jgi:hypothetical protein
VKWLLAFYVSILMFFVAGSGYFLARCVFELIIAIKYGQQEKDPTEKGSSSETPL